MLEADVMLCFTNITRDQCNDFARAARRIRTPWPRAGEPVACLRNAPLHGVFNGAVYTLERDFDEGDTDIQIDVDEASTTIPLVYFKRLPSALPHGVEAVTGFDFGYAMTVHKAQGSEWPNVVLIDEMFRPERPAWLYTGLTRASERMTVSTYAIGYKPPPPLPF
jgi:exodeoxyribonuclease-5